MNVESIVVLHVPIESIFCTLSFFRQLIFVAKGNKEQKQGVEIALLFVLLFWVKEFVIWESTLAEFTILCLAIFVNLVGNKVVEAHVLHFIWSFRIECVDQILFEDIGWLSWDLAAGFQLVWSDPLAYASCCVAVTHIPILWSVISHTGDLLRGDRWPRTDHTLWSANS